MVLCGPAGSGKTETVLDNYVSAVKRHGPDAVALLLPGRLACERVRRRLVQEGRLEGLLDPRILTFPDLAELILRANHEPVAALSKLQQRLLVRSIVRELDADGRLRALAGMCEFPGFIESLCETIGELKRIAVRPEQFRERMEEAGLHDDRSHDVASIYEAYQARLQELQLYDEAGRFWWARDVLERGARRPFEDLQVVLVDGFDDFTTTQLQVLDLLTAPAELVLITLPLECDAERRPEVFQRPRRTLARLHDYIADLCERWLDAPPAGGTFVHLGTRLFAADEQEPLADAAGTVSVIEAAGERAEVREVAVRVKRLILEGIAPERIAVIARDLSGYVSTIVEVFGRLGVPVRLHTGLPVGARPPVQAVLDLLRVPVEGYRLSHVMRVVKAEWLDREILGEDAPAVDEIERVACAANILGGSGPDEWAQRLRIYAAKLRAELNARRRNRRDEEQEWFRGSDSALEAEIALVERVQQALGRLFREFDVLPTQATYADYVEVLVALIQRFGISASIGTGTGEPAAANVAAFAAFRDALRELWAARDMLDIDTSISLAEFYAEVLAISTEVHFTPPGPPGGVLVLDTGQARQLNFDHVFILGMTERQFPRATREDPIFADDERERLARADIKLDLRRDSAWDDTFAFYTTVAATRAHLTLSYPTADAEGREVLSSHFVDEVMRCLQPAPKIEPYGLAQMIPDFCDAADFGELLERTIYELFGQDSEIEKRDNRIAQAALRTLARRDPHLLRALRRAIAVEDGRDSRDPPDHYDGRLSDAAAIATLAEEFGPDRPFSPSMLARFGNCPFAFFAEYVLGLYKLEEPTEDVDNMLLGTVMHRILSGFFREWRGRRADGTLKESDLPEARVLMDEFIDKLFADEVNRGTVADRVVWEITREDIRRDLQLLLEYEVHKVQSNGGRPTWFEQSFGTRELAPLGIGEGETAVALRGRIDRVDRYCDDEGRPRFAVYDYKRSAGGGPTDIKRGTEFQLPIYALAARRLVLQDPNAEIVRWGYYHYRRPIGLSGGFNRYSAEELIDVACENALAHAAAIRAGRFTPAPHNCSYCDFRGVCRWDEYRFGHKKGGEYDE